MSLDSDIGYGPSSHTWTFVADGVGRTRTVTFVEEHRLIGDVVWELLSAAKRKAYHGRGQTIINAIQCIRRLSTAIASTRPRPETPHGWAEALEANLRRDLTINSSTRWSYMNGSLPILSELARQRGERFSYRNPFKRRTVSKSPVPQGDDLEALVATARRDAVEIISAFRSPPEEHLYYVAEARRLAKDGLFVCSRSKKTPQDSLARRWRYATGKSAAALTAYLYPSADDLIPFLILLSVALAANPDSLCLASRTAIREFMHPSQGPSLVLTLEKPRAGEIPEYLVRDAGPLSSGWLLRAIMEMTTPLAAIAPEGCRNLLFISATYVGTVVPIIGSTRADAMRRYVKRNNLATTTLKQLRRARANEEWRRTKDPFRVQQLLRQADSAQAFEYLNDEVTVEADAVSIADVQADILSGRATRPPADSPTRGVLPSHMCLDPYDETRPKDEDGLCASYLWPFNDVHFIFSLEPRSVAWLLRDYEALCEAQRVLPGRRFEKLYAPRKRRIEADVLPLIDEDLRARAMALLPALGPTIPVEAM